MAGYFGQQIQDAMKHEHITRGDKVDAQTAGRLFEDVVHQLCSKPGQKVNKVDANIIASELGTALKDFGVLQITFEDTPLAKTGKGNNVVDKHDTLQVKTEGRLWNSTNEVPLHAKPSNHDLFPHKKYNSQDIADAKPMANAMWGYLGSKLDDLQKLQDEMSNHPDFFGKQINDNAGRHDRDVAVQMLCDWVNDNQNKYIFRPSTNSQHCDGFSVTDQATGKKTFIRLPDAEAHGQYINTHLQWK